MKAVFLDYQSLAPEDLDLSSFEALGLNCDYHNWTSPSDTSSRISGKEIVLSNKVGITAEHFQNHPELKLVIILATGTNNVDINAAKKHGVYVCNMVDYSTNSVVQHTFGMMLALSMRLPQYMQAIEQGDWQKSPFFGLLNYPIQEIHGKILGIIGYGKIGQAVAKIAEAFGMKVLISESLSGAQHKGRTPLQQVIEQSDFLNIHCPLTTESKNLIDQQAINAMRQGSVLINVGRGGIVCEHALSKALLNNHLAGAGIDVLATEPPTENSSPLLNKTIPNLIVTPHTAWGSQPARQNLMGQVVNIIKQYQKQEKLDNLL